MNAIEITGLCKQFKGKKLTRVDALKNLDLQIEAGEVFGFLGPNGAGKSTTIKLVMGLLKPTSGKASIMGMDSTLTDSRRQVGFLPENPAFYDYLSAEEYVAFVGSQFRMDAALLKRRSDEVLKGRCGATAKAWYSGWAWPRRLFTIRKYISWMSR